MSGNRYLALPESGRGPGVLLLHEAWGLTPDMKSAADRLASLGYVVSAPDLVEEMGGFARSISQLRNGDGPLVRRAFSEIDVLTSRREVTGPGIGVVGFSLGAALASLLDRSTDVAVLGLNYGMVPRHGLTRREVPIVASFGTRDRLLPAGSRTLLRRVGDGGPHDIREYLGAGHSFMTPSQRPRSRFWRRALSVDYDVAFAEHAWRRLDRHFQRHLPAVVIERMSS